MAIVSSEDWGWDGLWAWLSAGFRALSQATLTRCVPEWNRQ